MVTRRNSGRFCTCLSNFYKAVKTGNRVYTRQPYQRGIEFCTRRLHAKGKVRCTRIIKQGLPLRRF